MQWEASAGAQGEESEALVIYSASLPAGSSQAPVSPPEVMAPFKPLSLVHLTTSPSRISDIVVQGTAQRRGFPTRYVIFLANPFSMPSSNYPN